MARFLKYPSLTNHYNIMKNRQLIANLDNEFYATEKIHGANMSVEITKNGIRYFSRNQEVTLTDGNFGSMLNSTSNLEKVLEIGNDLLVDKNLQKVIIFGELYGAGVQSMEYQENLNKTKQFRVFDVFMENSSSAMRNLSLNELKEMFPEGLRVPVLNEIKTLREWLKTDLIDKSFLGGSTEGLVYKPVNETVFTLDSDSGAVQNYLGVKHKRDEFAEKRNPGVKVVREITSEELDFIENVKLYITPQRLDNVLSKGVELVEKNIGNIIKLMSEDIKKDFLEDNGEKAYFNDRLLGKQSAEIVKLIKAKMSEMLK